MPLLEDAFSALIGQAPWAALVLTVLYYTYRGLRREIGGLRKEIGDLKGIVVSLHLFLVDFMRLKGLFTGEEVEFAAKEIKRIAHVNDPLTPSEVEKLRKVLSKHVDEMEPEEVNELVQHFAERWIRDGDRLALDIFLRLAVVKGYVEQRRLGERR